MKKSKLKKPSLFFNSGASKMIVSFPQKETLFERCMINLNKEIPINSYYNNTYYPENSYYRDHRKEDINPPIEDNLSRYDKWLKAKFYVTQGGKFKTREDSSYYTSRIYKDRGKEKFWDSDYTKNIPNILSQECII